MFLQIMITDASKDKQGTVTAADAGGHINMEALVV
jgi:hypothetical protein